MFELRDSDGRYYYLFTQSGANQYMANFVRENPDKKIWLTGRMVSIEQAIAYEKKTA